MHYILKLGWVGKGLFWCSSEARCSPSGTQRVATHKIEYFLHSAATLNFSTCLNVSAVGSYLAVQDSK